MEAGTKPEVRSQTNGETDPEFILLEAVRAYRATLMGRALRVRLAVLLAGISLVPLALVVADHTWPGGLARWLLVVARVSWLATGVGAVLAIVLLTLGRPLSLAFVARRLERISQIDHNSLVNAILLRARAPLAYAEPAAVQQAVHDLATHEPSPAREARERPVHWLALLVALTAWSLYAVLGPKPIGPSLARLFGAERAAPSATWLELLRPGPQDAPHAGQLLEVVVAVHGRAVREVRLGVLDEAGAVRAEYVATESVGGTGDHRRFVLPPYEVQGDIVYRCVAGDGRLEGRIRIEPQPALESLRIVLEPPAGAGLEAQEAAGPDLDVVAGTRATFVLTANVALREPVFVFQGGRETRTRMRVDAAAPHVARLALLLVESGTYHLEFSDPWALPYRDPPEYRIDVRPDTPPLVTLDVPDEADTPDGVVDVERWGELVASAADDLAVRELVFVLEQVTGATRQSVLPADAPALQNVTGRVRTEGLLEPGQTARAWFEAADGHTLPDGRVQPQRARSRVVTLQRAAAPAAAGERGGEPESGARGPGGKPEMVGDDGGASGGEERGEPQDAGRDGEPQGGAERDPNERPSGARPSSAAEGAAPGDAPAGEEPVGSDTEDEVRGFVKEHGQEAKEAGKTRRERAQGQPGADTPASGEGAPEAPLTSRPAETPPTEAGDAPMAGESEGGTPRPGATATAPAEGTGEKPGAEAGATEAPQAGPAGDAEPNAAVPAGASPGEGARNYSPPREAGEAARPEAEAPAEPGMAGEAPKATAPLESDGLAETLDLLEMLERGEPLTEDMLVEAGWPREKAARFVKALERLRAVTQAAGGVGALRHELFDTRVGRAERLEGGATADTVRRELDPQVPPGEAQRRIAPPAEQRVRASLQDLLEAYYRSLARQRARAGSSD